MTELDDPELLAEYARTGSEVAFATLAARHVNLVYSAALRFTSNPHHAEEITQAVFIILARKAHKLGRGAMLSGWLYQTARLTSANFVKGEIRRQNREQEAYMQSTLGEPEAMAWEQIAPLLDEAMGQLGQTDRNAVVLRYFENKTAREVAAALKLNEAAAHKRVHRAVEKLRKFFTKRGIALSATLVVGAVSANSIQAAPTALADSVTVMALTKGAAASGSTLTLVKGALKIMAWTKAKTAVSIGVGMLLAAGTVTVTVRESRARGTASWQTFDPKEAVSILRNTPPQVQILSTKFPRGAAIPSRPTSHTMSWISVTGDGKAIGMDCNVGEVMRYAYSKDAGSVSRERLVVEAELPKEGFDFIANLDQGAKPAMQLEIENKLGLVASFEQRTVDVMVLRQKDGANSSTTSAMLQGVVEVGDGAFMLWHQTSMSELARHLDNWVKVPVMDQTGITNHFDLTLKWALKNGDSEEQLKQVLLNKLGLELVPGRESVEMLVVRKAKDGK